MLNSLWDNKYFAIAVVQRDGKVLEFVSAALRDDIEVVSLAIAQNKQALRFASNNLQTALQLKDKEASASDLDKTSKRQRKTSIQSLALVTTGESAVFETVLAAVKRDGELLLQADHKLKDNHQIVLAAVTQNGRAIAYASKRWKKNREIALVAVSNAGDALGSLPQKIRDDFDVVLTAVTQHGKAVDSASARLKKNTAIALAAINNTAHAFPYIAKELQKDPEFRLAAIKVNPRVIGYIDTSFAEQADFMAEVVDFYHEKYIKGKAKQTLFGSHASTLGKFNDIILSTASDVSSNSNSHDLGLSSPGTELFSIGGAAYDCDALQAETAVKRKLTSEIGGDSQAKRSRVETCTSSAIQSTSSAIVQPKNVKLTRVQGKTHKQSVPHARPQAQIRTVANNNNTLPAIATPEIDSHSIGRWGEEVVYLHWFEQRYQAKYSDFTKTETPKGFKLSKQKMTIEVQWHNKGLAITRYTTHDCDMEVIKTNHQGEVIQHKFVEVKTTCSAKDIHLNFSPNEVRLMRRCKHEEKDSINKYRLFKVFKANQADPMLEKEANPYKRLKEAAGFTLRDKSSLSLTC